MGLLSHGKGLKYYSRWNKALRNVKQGNDMILLTLKYHFAFRNTDDLYIRSLYTHSGDVLYCIKCKVAFLVTGGLF